MKPSVEVVPPQGQVFEEKRGHHRRRVLKVGTINFNKGCSSLGCRVRNVTDSGATLVMGETLGVPNRFHLKIDGHSSIMAEIVWRTPQKVGVRYINADDE